MWCNLAGLAVSSSTIAEGSVDLTLKSSQATANVSSSTIAEGSVDRSGTFPAAPKCFKQHYR